MYADTFSQVYCGSRLGTVPRVLDGLREAAGNTPQDRWIVGYAYDDTGIDEKRHLTREDLDAYPRNARSLLNIFPSIFAT